MSIPETDEAFSSEFSRVLQCNEAASDLVMKMNKMGNELQSQVLKICSSFEMIGVMLARDGAKTFIQPPDLSPLQLQSEDNIEISAKLNKVLSGWEGAGLAIGAGAIGAALLGPVGWAALALGAIFHEEIQRKKLRKHSKKEAPGWFSNYISKLEPKMLSYFENAHMKAESTVIDAFQKFLGLEPDSVDNITMKYEKKILRHFSPEYIQRHQRKRIVKRRLLAASFIIIFTLAIFFSYLIFSYNENLNKEYQAYIEKAEKAYTGKRWNDALSAIKIALKIKETDMGNNLLKTISENAFNDLYSQGAEAFANGYWDNAISLLGSAVVVKKDEKASNMLKQAKLEKLINIAQKQYNKGNYRDAYSSIEQALDINMNHVKANELKDILLTKLRKYTNSIGMEFILIPAGEFKMGCPYGEGRFNESPQHNIKIKRPFYLQSTEVTLAQWIRIIGNSPNKLNDKVLPVTNITWYEAHDFIRKLSKKEGTNYRLPTEAEWEYACRASSKGQYYFGNDKNKLHEYAWFVDNSKNKIRPVAAKKPNRWGLYDMHGNAWEWCDGWPSRYNGGPSYGNKRVIRGGSKSADAKSCRSTCREFINSNARFTDLGFRIVKDF